MKNYDFDELFPVREGHNLLRAQFRHMCEFVEEHASDVLVPQTLLALRDAYDASSGCVDERVVPPSPYELKDMLGAGESDEFVDCENDL